MTAAVVPLLGRQEPTFLWVPPFEHSEGDSVVELAASAGLVLDPFQRLLCWNACALDPLSSWAWLCFEVAAIISRQNGKDSWLEAMELSWLFLFGDRLIIHSAHLFETSREHFLRMQALITNHDDFRRRVKRMREGRGSEEIELIGGQRLKFMTRKGGAGRGFVGNKTVYNEAMYLDADMMAASLPTMATVPNAQVIYAGSAGMKYSTQLGLVRRRAYALDDPSLMLAEWAAEKAVYDERGRLVAGDDPAAEETWAKVNPGFGIRITAAYIRKEMAALGGPNSRQFGTERLGIGDWPEEDESWLVIDKDSWERQADPGSQIADKAPIALGLWADTERAMGTIGACGLREDGRRHFEVIERHRGTGWILGATGALTGRPVERDDPDRPLTEFEQGIVDRMVELKARHQVAAVAVLKTSAAASLIAALKRAGLPVVSPSEIEYAQACGDLYEAVVEKRTLMHLGQASVNTAVGGARKRVNAEGGWRWASDTSVDAGPIVVGTIALWALKGAESVPEPEIFS